MRIGIKVGSGLLVEMVNGKEVINVGFIYQLCVQICKLMSKGHVVFLITSGAVASDPKKHRSKNLRAAVGQNRLMNNYTDIIERLSGFEVAQILLTDHDFKHPAVLKATVEEAFDENVVVVINANDPVSNDELRNLEKCEDNDRLFGFVCPVVKADLALIALDRDGLEDFSGKVVREVAPDEIGLALSYAKGGSAHGHGKNGMWTKVNEAAVLADKGIKAMLVPARQKNAFVDAVNLLLGHSKEKLGTVFITKSVV